MTSIGLTPLRNATSSSLAMPRAGKPSNTRRATGSSPSSADLYLVTLRSGSNRRDGRD